MSKQEAEFCGDIEDCIEGMAPGFVGEHPAVVLSACGAIAGAMIKSLPLAQQAALIKDFVACLVADIHGSDEQSTWH